MKKQVIVECGVASRALLGETVCEAILRFASESVVEIILQCRKALKTPFTQPYQSEHLFVRGEIVGHTLPAQRHRGEQ
jgi:hypothetical protein